ncbi:uncharacterized protein RHOBADRAFT_65656 [Rhodotorula graminis WP1]|uniref:Uncharacterized protein n=1 Tax=Rhodotorula graminis (strain WP1) TaxID=578459 RepID=A0A0N8PZG1_RHOGW|nr:uncharacterized protein RHOBADRAFT_65656 [Rhodotorula graminis WP1]KPV72229.1 hypothetical protein RHOBADRAFT_65656 [Rhodotorula graminis WP1]
MSNSDKFEQDDAIVADESVPQQPAGVLDSNDDELSTDQGINAPEDGNYESVKGNEISKDEFENDEFDGVKKENILDSNERSTRSKTNFAKADEEADKLVDQVADGANDGTSRIA